MDKTYTVILELSVEAQSEEEAIKKFKEKVPMMEENYFEVMGEPEE